MFFISKVNFKLDLTDFDKKISTHKHLSNFIYYIFMLVHMCIQIVPTFTRRPINNVRV